MIAILEIELWKPIKINRKKTDYAISSLGRVFSRKTNTFIKLKPQHKHYLMAPLWVDGKAVNKQVHRLVAKAFIPNPKHRAQVNHINGDKNDNRVSNLEWVTNRQNSKHAVANDLCHSKLSKEDVFEIAKLLMENKLSFDQIGKNFGISGALIGCIYRKEVWKRIVEPYKFPKRVNHVPKRVLRKMFKLLVKGYSPTEVAKQCGSYRAFVDALRRGKLHPELGCEYGFGN